MGLLIQVETDAAGYLQKAKSAFLSTNYEQAYTYARRSLSLRRSREARMLAADAAMLTGQYRAGIRLGASFGRKDTPHE